MFEEEKTFAVRVNLVARFPERYEGDEDGYAWLREWEARLKPALLKTVMATLRDSPAWTARVRNRGAAPEDEVEIVMEKTFAADA